MPTRGSCVICQHESRADIDLLLAASASYRTIRTKYGASLRSLSEHRSAGHHLEASDNSNDSKDSKETPSASGPWVHADVVRDLLGMIVRAVPVTAERVRLADRIANQVEAAEASGFVCDALTCDLTDDEVADARRTNQGLVLLPTQTGQRWEARWHSYAPSPTGPQLVEATAEQIKRAGVEPRPNETDRGTERAVRNTELEGATR